MYSHLTRISFTGDKIRLRQNKTRKSCIRYVSKDRERERLKELEKQERGEGWYVGPLVHAEKDRERGRDRDNPSLYQTIEESSLSH